MSKSGSKIREQVAHFLVDIHNPEYTLLFAEWILTEKGAFVP